MQIVTALPPGLIGAAVMAMTAGIVAWQLPRVRGTTLTAPFWWAVASSGALGTLEAARLTGTLAGLGPLARSVATYLGACTTFCPLMAVLGAKRPQDRAWQWIVASLWLILAVPAVQSIVAATGRQFLLTGPWRWFVILLLVVGLAVYFPTRFRPAALLAAMGQTLLLAPALLPAAAEHNAWLTTIGCCLLAVAALGAVRRTRSDRQTDAELAAWPELAASQDRWRRFCDAWGALWALRLMLRINQTAELQGWPVRLQLGAFYRVEPAAEKPTADYAPQIEAALDAVLRRFERKAEE